MPQAGVPAADVPATVDQARWSVVASVEHYNTVRWHSVIGDITPTDKLNGMEPVIYAEHDRKLEETHQRRQLARPSASTSHTTNDAATNDRAVAGGCLMCRCMTQSISTWAEDTAPQRCNPSADPGPKTAARTVPQPSDFLSFGIGNKANNLRGTKPRLFDRKSPLNLLTPTSQNSISR